ncbi:MAG: UvrD-helicase domain-containing protein, partial [Patescibacteria group bacterium]|nr:UvrD-helicase domain-containing protein [Patescibacteria group bacterium]
ICVELFQKYPAVLEKYQTLFRYILVDEYQDTNHAQYVWTNLLAKKHRNLFVIGDDWQSIYSWRGANFENILNFEKDYKEAKIIKLEQNYRSTQIILEAARDIIEKNVERSEKKLWTKKKEGEKIEVFEARDEKDEARFVAQKVEDLDRKDISLKDIAVLYRINAESRILEEVFLHYNLPYKIVGGVRFYERREIKDILAYLKFIVSEDDLISFDRIVNMPGRGIGEASLLAFHDYLKKSGRSLREGLENLDDVEKISSKAKKGFEEFQKVICDLGEKKESLELVPFIDYVMRQSGYFKYLESLDEKSGEGVEGEVRKENLGELLSVAEEFSKGHSDYTLENFLEEVTLLSDIDSYSSDSDAVTFMTIHSAKGLEFKYVFIVGLEEGIFPHSRSQLEPAEMEEERRLMYVAITRAKEQVTLSYAQKRMSFGNTKFNMPSRFLADISEELILGSQVKEEPKEKNDFLPEIKLSPGDTISHQVFGEGIITQINDDEIEVSFPKLGLKKLSIYYAPIRKIKKN